MTIEKRVDSSCGIHLAYAGGVCGNLQLSWWRMPRVVLAPLSRSLSANCRTINCIIVSHINRDTDITVLYNYNRSGWCCDA